MKYTHNILFLILITICHLIIIFTFTKGFLLTKTNTNEISKCNDTNTKELTEFEFNKFKNHSYCFKPIFNRSIILLIDALRFDFTDKITIFNDTITKYPNNAFLFKSYADPPTTTMQRLLALTTGGMPTFIDISSNFNSKSIMQDNWIQQMKSYGKKIIIMGDDTWIKMYPNQFEKSYPFPSFNVKDLHTVDNGVIQHLIPEITSNKDWNVIIGHFLGVDHVGHRFGAYHPEMDQKLAQMDRVIKKTMEYIDEDTVLFIMGDHGMVDNGYHAGSSDSETNTALFIYSPRNIFKNTKVFENDLLQYKKESILINQIDFVSTISLLMGIPIPFENLGSIVPEIFLGINYQILNKFLYLNKYNESIIPKHNLIQTIQAMYVNSQQIIRYIEAYALKSKQFDHSNLLKIRESLNEAKKFHQDFSDSSFSIESFINAFNMYKKFFNITIDICRNIWTSYNDKLMIFSIIISVLFIMISIYIIFAKNTNIKDIIQNSLNMKILLNVKNFHIKFLEPICYILLFIVRSTSLLSSSYVLEEKNVIYFLLMTQLFIILLAKILKKNTSISNYFNIFKIIILLKLFTYSNCGNHEIYFNEQNIIIIIIQTFLSFIMLGWKIYKKSKNQSFINQTLNMISMFFVIIYWICLMTNLLDNLWIVRIIFPRFVYIQFTFRFLITCLKTQISYKEKIQNLLFISIPSTLLIFGPGSPFTILILIAIINLYEQEYYKYQSSEKISNFEMINNSIKNALFFHMLIYLTFYTTGHTTNFNSIQFSAPFVGFDELNYYLAIIIILFNTLYPFLVIPFIIPQLSAYYKKKKLKKRDMINSIKLLSLFNFISYILSMISAFIQRRHLFIWSIFAPRFIFESAFLISLDIGLILSIIIYYTSNLKQRE